MTGYLTLRHFLSIRRGRRDFNGVIDMTIFRPIAAAALIAAAISTTTADPAAAMVTFELELGPIDHLEDAPPAAFAGFLLGETVRLRVSMDETAPDALPSDRLGLFEDPDAAVTLIGADSGAQAALFGGISLRGARDFESAAYGITGTRIIVSGFVDPSLLGPDIPWVLGGNADWLLAGDVDVNRLDLLLGAFLSPDTTLYPGNSAAIDRYAEDWITELKRVLRVSPLSVDIHGVFMPVPAPPAAFALLGGLGVLVAASRRRRVPPAC